MPGLEASGAPLHATTLLSTARAEHRGGKSRLARWELLTARVLCLFAGTTGVYPRAYRKGTLTGTAGSSRTTGNRGDGGGDRDLCRYGVGGNVTFQVSAAVAIGGRHTHRLD